MVATVAAAVFEWGAMFVVLGLTGSPQEFSAEDVAIYAWSFGPYMLTIGALAAFGAMQAAEAARRSQTLRTLQLEHVRFTRQAYEARLAALQARVEPRFLFETLSDVEALYEKDAALGAQVMDDLIVYLRAALPAIEETSSTLGAELKLVRTWLDIVRVRSAERLSFAMTDSEAPLDARMPPMLLLPLVQHAVEDGNDATRAIFVSAAIVDDRVRVTVIGPASAFAPSNHSPALRAVGERLEALYGDLATLMLQSALHDRTQATVEIPYERTDRGPR
jgi:LytS/YehU family sensor histidine kinase